MRRTSFVVILIGVAVSTAFLFQQISDNSSDQAASANSKESVPAALDYSKPIFTRYGVVVCPQSLLFDMRADHSPYKVIEMFNSVWSRDDKAKELGCEELRDGIPVSATPLQAGLASVTLPAGTGGNLFTMENELTNGVLGQSNEAKSDLAEPHINPRPEDMTGSLNDAITGNGLGSALVAIPSSRPIQTGSGRAARSLDGFGAVLCPNTNLMGLLWDSYRSPNGTLDLAHLKSNSCSYVPPDTPLVSEGANSQNSLAVVTATLPDGTTIHGVTFSTMFVQSQLQPVQPPDLSNSSSSPEQHKTSSDSN